MKMSFTCLEPEASRAAKFTMKYCSPCMNPVYRPSVEPSMYDLKDKIPSEPAHPVST